MTRRLVLPTVSESDELFMNGFIILQERRPSSEGVGSRNEKVEVVRPHLIRQRSSFLWRNDVVTTSSDGTTTTATKQQRRRRRSQRSNSRRNLKSRNMDDSESMTIIKNHIMETTIHTKNRSDHIPRQPIRRLPSLYFP